MASKKKIATAAVATTLAASLLLGGTFAWQSISQTALNEKEAVVNPGGRLHDDFNGTNKDVYVENFAENDIYARVRLDEYFEIVMNKGTAAEKTEQIAGTDKDDTSTYVTHLFDATNKTDTWWDWTTGGTTTYMPTFNMNKDSLVADINGTMDYEDGEGNADPYGDYVDYTLDENKTKTGTEIYDGDTNNLDEVGTDFDNLNTYVTEGNVVTHNETHTAAATGTATLISMAEWLALGEDDDTDNYWVYDTDGWVYYSSPIEADTATGLLLDEIGLKGVMDDSYYYAINVVAQFITADDLGKDNDTGFYQDADQAPSEDALNLLKKIGVDVDATESDNDADNGDDTNTNDGIAPTVSAHTETSNYVYEFTISNVEEKDYPLSVAIYELTEADAEYETPVYTFNIVRDESGQVSYTDFSKETGYYGSMSDVTEESGTITVVGNFTPAQNSYMGIAVTDSDGNVGKPETANAWVQHTGCFAAGTQVLTVEGLKNIEEIAVGDFVYAVDLETQTKSIQIVQAIHNQGYTSETYTIYTEAGDAIVSSPEHLFYVEGEWIQAADLKVGDVLTSMTGAAGTITGIDYEKREKPMLVYNLTVSGHSNFLITENEILVHNITK